MKLTINKSRFKLLTENKKCSENIEVEVPLQIKTTYPMRQEQVIEPDDAYAGLKKVTVDAIPDSYIIPAGQKEITRNGTHDVHDYVYAIVNVPSISAEEWDGSYEEIVNGFTLTLNIDSAKVTLNNADFTYSLDSGVTWNQYTSTTMILEDVTKIMFSWGVGHTAVQVGTTSGGADIVLCEINIDSDDIILTEDAVWYVSSYYTGVGGGND